MACLSFLGKHSESGLSLCTILAIKSHKKIIQEIIELKNNRISLFGMLINLNSIKLKTVIGLFDWSF